MASKQTFKAVLEKHPTMEATGITIPFDVEAVFGAKRVPVKALINGCEYRGSIVRMGGRYMLGIPKAIRDAAGAKAGEEVKVVVERDAEERTVAPPPDLAKSLKKNPAALARWEKLSFTHKKEYARALEDAKKAETRARRLEKTIESLTSSKKT
jgi:bifunctional DNA-binding transcriptional regulator/antitoxin component of YhaV-PrlF toxin-antitoxin module